MSTFSAVPDDDGTAADEILEPPARNGLDELRGIVDAQLAPDEATYDVPTRPGWSVRYSAGIDGEKIKHWVRRSTPRSGPGKGELDQTKWGCLVLGTQAVAILKNGEHPTESGDPITFRDPAFLELTGATSVSDCVQVFYGGKEHIGDGHIAAQAIRLVRLAGYDENGVRLADDETDLPDEGPTGR